MFTKSASIQICGASLKVGSLAPTTAASAQPSRAPGGSLCAIMATSQARRLRDHRSWRSPHRFTSSSAPLVSSSALAFAHAASSTAATPLLDAPAAHAPLSNNSRRAHLSPHAHARRRHQRCQPRQCPHCQQQTGASHAPQDGGQQHHLRAACQASSPQRRARHSCLQWTAHDLINLGEGLEAPCIIVKYVFVRRSAWLGEARKGEQMQE